MIAAIGVLCGVTAFGAVGEWRTYTSMRDVRALARDRQGIVWAATGGGMFSYAPGNGAFRTFATSEGLQTTDLTAIAVDSAGHIWSGAANGLLHRYSPSDGTWMYVYDIAIRPDPQKRINGLAIVGDTLFIMSDIGLSAFSITRSEFRETFARFGTAPAQLTGNVTSMAIFGGKLWVGTRGGAASTPLATPNMAVPEAWQIYTTARGLASNAVRGLAALGDTLYAATGGGVSMLTDTAWTIVPGTAGLDIPDIRPSGFCGGPSALSYITTACEGTIVDGGVTVVACPVPAYELTAIATGCGDFVATRQNGLLEHTDSTFVSRLPPGPPSNKFVGLAVDERGVVYSGTGTGNGEGFMSFNGTTWRAYTTATEPLLPSNNFYQVDVGAQNVKWVSGFGQGLVLLDDGGEIARVFNATNGLLPSIDPSFVVIGGAATDQFGTTWIANRTPPGDTAAVTYTSAGVFGYVRGLATRSNPVRVFTDVVIDQVGTKWFANFNRFESVLPDALYFYNERFALPRTSFGWGSLSLADGLTSNKVYALAAGPEGELWVGSDAGISIFFDPSTLRPAPYHPLRDQVIQSIVIDALGNKWVGTRQGVFVLSSDGTTVLDRYTSESTQGKLLDNDVASIAIDHRSGTIYFGTEKGLSSLSTAAIAPNRSFGDLVLAPNPFYVPSSTSLTIDGLVQSSRLKVLSIDGSLVRELETPGGRVGFWDGLDAHGEQVGTGVYLIVAYSEDGSKVATGKVALIRR
jgi:hypothetical protein